LLPSFEPPSLVLFWLRRVDLQVRCHCAKQERARPYRGAIEQVSRIIWSILVRVCL